MNEINELNGLNQGRLLGGGRSSRRLQGLNWAVTGKMIFPLSLLFPHLFSSSSLYTVPTKRFLRAFGWNPRTGSWHLGSWDLTEGPKDRMWGVVGQDTRQSWSQLVARSSTPGSPTLTPGRSFTSRRLSFDISIREHILPAGHYCFYCSLTASSS